MSSPASPAQRDVAQHRDYLYRYALLHLRDASRADDVVQETLLAARWDQLGSFRRACRPARSADARRRCARRSLWAH